MIRLQWWTVELLSTRSQHDSYDYPLTRSRSQAGVAVPADFYVHQPWTRVKGRFLTCDRRGSGRSRRLLSTHGEPLDLHYYYSRASKKER